MPKTWQLVITDTMVTSTSYNKQTGERTLINQTSKLWFPSAVEIDNEQDLTRKTPWTSEGIYKKGCLTESPVSGVPTGEITESSVAPSNPQNGDLWIYMNNGSETPSKMYYFGEWIACSRYWTRSISEETGRTFAAIALYP